MRGLQLLLTFASIVPISAFTSVNSFSRYISIQASKSSHQTRFVKTGRDDFPDEESADYKGSVDWDAEWKKVVETEGKTTDGSQRPGQDFYKSDAEIAAIKATNKAAERVSEVTYKVSASMPSMGSLTGDWKFWIGLLAIISIGFAVLTAPPGVPQGGSAESYFI